MRDIEYLRKQIEAIQKLADTWVNTPDYEAPDWITYTLTLRQAGEAINKALRLGKNE